MKINLLPDPADGNSCKLLNVCEIYGLKQLITELTRVTAKSQSLIALCLITNTPDKIVRSGVVPLGISDHFLIYLIRKMHYSNPDGVKVITKRSLKNFKTAEFLKDVCERPWDDRQFSDHNNLWEFWKNQLLACTD